MSENVTWHEMSCGREERERILKQKGAVYWFFGLSGSGKSTAASAAAAMLCKAGRLTYTLDGDNIRHGLNSDLGFSESDRKENIRRIAETAKLFADSGVITLVSFISPLNSLRSLAKGIIGADDFHLIYVKCPIEVCIERDPKGLYKRAMAGEIKEFTGISAPFEEPIDPQADIVGDSSIQSPDDIARDFVSRFNLI